MNNIKAVIWDLDGTLLNTLDDLTAATNHALTAEGYPTRTTDEVRRFIGNGVKRLLRRALPPDAGDDVHQRALTEFRAYYTVHGLDATHPYPGVPEALRQLRDAGFRMAMVTNKSEERADVFRRQFFGDTIETTVGDHPSRPCKPAPDGTLEALRRLGVTAEEAVFVGDSDVDMQTAHNSGLACISVTWGFRDGEFLLEHGATTLVDTPAELVRLLTE